jgi:hypothetical protein
MGLTLSLLLAITIINIERPGIESDSSFIPADDYLTGKGKKLSPVSYL